MYVQPPLPGASTSMAALVWVPWPTGTGMQRAQRADQSTTTLQPVASSGTSSRTFKTMDWWRKSPRRGAGVSPVKDRRSWTPCELRGGGSLSLCFLKRLLFLYSQTHSHPPLISSVVLQCSHSLNRYVVFFFRNRFGFSLRVHCQWTTPVEWHSESRQ